MRSYYLPTLLMSEAKMDRFCLCTAIANVLYHILLLLLLSRRHARLYSAAPAHFVPKTTKG